LAEAGEVIVVADGLEGRKVKGGQRQLTLPDFAPAAEAAGTLLDASQFCFFFVKINVLQ